MMNTVDSNDKIITLNKKPEILIKRIKLNSFSIALHTNKESIQKLIEKCWSKDPKNRPSFRKIISKQSNINKKDDDYDYLIEDVDIDESDQIGTLEKDSKQFKNKIKLESQQ